MKHDWMKIPLAANELGVSVKTIYNWIGDGKLFMPRPGYVSMEEAWNVWADQRSLRSTYSYFMAVKGTKRDANGQFSKALRDVE